MLDRIGLVLKTQNLTVSQFADKIGIQRSALSHVLAGRNNPSLDFVTKTMKAFPDLNPSWLLFGKGKMYDKATAILEEKREGGSEENVEIEEQKEGMNLEFIETEGLNSEEDLNLEGAEQNEAMGHAETATTGREVAKIILFYTDGHFKEYNPLQDTL